MDRPTGVTVLAIIQIIFGILMVMGALALIALAGLAGLLAGELVGFPGLALLAAAFGGIIAVFLLIIAVIEFVLAWGLLGGKGWAWTLTLIFTALGIVMNLFSLPAISSLVIIGLDAIILYYLFRPNVKAFFEKGPAEAYQPPPPPPLPTETQQIPTCPRCGKPLTYIEQYQRWYCYSCQQYA